MKSNRGQEEMVGFALIVVIFAVIFIVILGVLIRTPATPEITGSRDLHYFVESMLYTTSSCSLTSAPDYASVAELAVACAANPHQTCDVSEQKVCLALNQTVREILDRSWYANPEHPATGYNLTMSFSPPARKIPEVLMTTSVGTCSGDYRADSYLLREGTTRGMIEVVFKVCP